MAVLGAMLGIGCLSQATTASAEPSWLNFGYDAGHTGYNPTEKQIKRKSVHKLAKTAEFPVNAEPRSPVVYKGAIYIRSLDGNVYAYDLASGGLKWENTNVPLPSAGSSYDIAVSANRLIVTCYVGMDPNPTSGICALDPSTGAELWTYAIGSGGPFTPPVIAGDTVYLGETGVQPDQNDADAFVAVRLKNGKERWRFWSCAPGPVCMNISGSAPAVDGGLVYFGCAGGSGFTAKLAGTCALDADSGGLVWNVSVGDPNHADWQGRLVARSGTIYETYQTVNCYQCGYTIDMLALDGASGGTLWDTPLTPVLVNAYYPTGAPTIGADGTIYQAISTSNNPNQPNLFAVNADGTIQWQVSSVQNLGNSPTIVGHGRRSVLFYGCGGAGTSGTTCAYDPTNGTLLWTSQEQGWASRFAPVVTGGVVYNNCNSNSICAYTKP